MVSARAGKDAHLLAYGGCMRRRDAMVVRAFCVWTVLIWATRIGNVLGDDARDVAFKAVHVVLALVSVALAVLSWGAVARARADGDKQTVAGQRA